MRTLIILLLCTLFHPVVYSQFYPGHYYTHSGERVDGQLKHDYFAEFVNGPDSFMIVRNFQLWELAKYDEDFVKILIPGKITKVLHHTTQGSEGTRVTSVFYVRDGVVYDSMEEAAKDDRKFLAEWRKADTEEEKDELLQKYNAP